MAALSDGASMLEILVVIFAWRKLAPIDISDKLSLPLHRIQELLESIRARWGAVASRQDNARRIAADDRRQAKAGFAKYRCPQCAAEFRLQILDPRLCEKCLAPLRRILTVSEQQNRKAAAKQRRRAGRGAA
jgi:hypothetical protein